MREVKNKGFTLTEMAIVLGALGLLLGGVWAVVGVVWEGYQLNRLKEDLFQTVQNVQNHYVQAGTLPGSDGANITSILDDDDRRLIPVTMRANPRVEGTAINHALATSVAGTFSISRQASGRQFRVTMTNIRQDSCQKLLMTFPVLLPELGARRMATQAEAVTVDPRNPATPSSGDPLPLSVSDANDWCPDQTNNTVSYDFTLRP